METQRKIDNQNERIDNTYGIFQPSGAEFSHNNTGRFALAVGRSIY